MCSSSLPEAIGPEGVMTSERPELVRNADESGMFTSSAVPGSPSGPRFVSVRPDNTRRAGSSGSLNVSVMAGTSCGLESAAGELPTSTGGTVSGTTPNVRMLESVLLPPLSVARTWSVTLPVGPVSCGISAERFHGNDRIGRYDHAVDQQLHAGDLHVIARLNGDRNERAFLHLDARRGRIGVSDWRGDAHRRRHALRVEVQVVDDLKPRVSIGDVRNAAAQRRYRAGWRAE